MSLFLGPVHHWMYQKIERRHRRLNALISRLRERHGAELLEGSGMSAEGVGELNDGQPLETLVQGFGIHDFLQSQINAVENAEGRLLAAVCVNLNGTQEHVLDDLYTAAREFGRTEAEAQLKASGPEDRTDLEALVDTLHLEAMPCSPVAEGARTDDAFVYRHVQCPHLASWQGAGVDPQVMCKLERAWLAGIAEASGMRHEPGTTILEGAKFCEDRFIAS